jgi:GNAT superfamily N-acetyltransferase
MSSLIPIQENQFDTFFALIEELADFEALARPDADAKSRLKLDICGDQPRIKAYLIESNDTYCGYVITFHSYSSFLAKPTLYLEDIYIQPNYRGKGIGKNIMNMLADYALQQGCGRMEWVVLDWNTSAQEFYHGLGAVHMKEWFPFRLTEDAMKQLINKNHE